MTLRTRLVGAAALLFLAIAGSGCDAGTPWTPTPTPGAPPPPPPPAGITLAGTVSDAAFRYLSGARVEVVAGAGAGLSTVVRADGQFRLEGPFDDTTQVRATANGHLDRTLPFPAFCAPCNPNWWLHFTLESEAPHADLAGNYLMTFVAAGECSTLPDEARERTFTVGVASSIGNSQFYMTFSGATIRDHLTQASGGFMGIVGEYLSLWLGDHGRPGVVEEVAPNVYLAIEGVADGSVGPAANEISLLFNGYVDYCALSGPMPGSFYSCTPSLQVTRSQCHSPNHRLVLRRMD